ncbi:YceI family protein [Joostella atrarenae]|uniref:YceI family protein n=1 Tax=Joostella atrarenae TaxID=679257 RepID=A0ABS9J2W9_9FLAO|nr:YceI family protein [Joostella atrarenae]MCF8714771.1 YceI family protein [Joostella atrarenae]
MKKIGITFIALAMVMAVSCKKKESKTEVKENVEAVAKEPLKLRNSLQFTAFKTPEKVGVKGTFTEINLTNIQEDENAIKDILTGANFEINTSSISTKDAGRDIKLKEFFFDNLASQKITGTFKSFNGNEAIVTIKMNDVEKDIPFELNATENDVLLSGSIDMIEDFSANEAFKAIHEACKVLHQDKTWTDVNIDVTIAK